MPSWSAIGKLTVLIALGLGALLGAAIVFRFGLKDVLRALPNEFTSAPGRVSVMMALVFVGLQYSVDLHSWLESIATPTSLGSVSQTGFPLYDYMYAMTATVMIAINIVILAVKN